MLVSFVLLGLLLVINTKSENGMAELQVTTVDSKVKMDIKTMHKTLFSKNKKNQRKNLLFPMCL